MAELREDVSVHVPALPADTDPRLVEFSSLAPLLRGLSADARAEVVRVARVARYPRRTAIFHEGDEPTALYGVITGAVKIYRDLPSGRQRILEVVEPGRAFATIPTLDGRPYPASAMTVPDSEPAIFPRRALATRLRSNPEAAFAALEDMG